MKINCLNPNHVDKTPSMHVYHDGCWCYVCGYKCSLEEVTTKSGEVTIEEIKKLKKQEPENIEEKIEYISNCVQKNVRGLTLPADSEGYYCVWPDKTYYKLRRYDDRPRYVGPKGIRSPIFWIKSKEKSSTVVVVEGEFNAISLQQAFPDHKFHIVSPGSVNELARHFEFYLQFSKIYVIVDRDAAGVANGMRLRDDLKKKGKSVKLIALERDFNDLLQTDGTAAIQETLRKELGIQGNRS